MMVFQTSLLLFRRKGAHQLAAPENATRMMDVRALDAFSRLSDEHLRDIGVSRKLHRTTWDLFDRSLSPECKPVFVYFRLGR